MGLLEGGLIERGLIGEGGLFTKLSDNDIFRSFTVLFSSFSSVLHKYINLTQLLSQTILRLK